MSTVIITGEVLFDIFDDGSQVLGGAPFNVAWHLHGLGINPLFISAVGADSRGDEIRKAMQSWGMDTTVLQTDSQHPTGTVQVRLQNGSPTFDIVKDTAYDFIATPQLGSRIDNCKMLYHGSLAMRSPVTRQTIQKLRKESGLPSFVDVNLRAPFWEQTFIEELIDGANWVKLNDEELRLLSNDSDQELVSCAQRFREMHDLPAMIVTRGKEGAFMVTEDVVEQIRSAPIKKLVDTVGAGDGFSAMTIAGLLQGWELQEVLEAASLFAAKICELRGALSTDRAFYDDFLDEIH